MHKTMHEMPVSNVSEGKALFSPLKCYLRRLSLAEVGNIRFSEVNKVKQRHKVPVIEFQNGTILYLIALRAEFIV